MNERDWLSPNIRAVGRERALKAGRTLFRAGQRPVGLYEVISGRVRLLRVDRAGRETVLYSANAGDTIAEASLFSKSYHCDAIATTPARVRLYPKDAIFAEFNSNPDAARAFMARLANQLMEVRTRLQRRNIHSARERLQHYFAVNVGADGRTVRLAGTVKELAADLGLTHEVVYRTLARMVADREIKRFKNEIRLMRGHMIMII